MTGEVLTCNKCPPGTHMKEHCTATTHTQCAPCRADHFTELWNYLPRCLYCSTMCTENQEVEEECSPVSDRVCRCKEGFYWNNDFCATHAECAPGYGVQTKGRGSLVSTYTVSKVYRVVYVRVYCKYLPYSDFSFCVCDLADSDDSAHQILSSVSQIKTRLKNKIHLFNEI